MAEAWDEHAGACEVPLQAERLTASPCSTTSDRAVRRFRLHAAAPWWRASCLSVGGSSIGVFLILRRMSLMGDALAHALLPGAALGFLLGGLSLPAMSLGGFLAGITTALVSGVDRPLHPMREDASFAAAYLTALALGVLIVSLRGSAVDLMNILFGAILAVDEAALVLVARRRRSPWSGSPRSTGRWSSNASTRASSPPWASGARSITTCSCRSPC